MKLAVVMTAYNRTDMLGEVLESWGEVEGIDEVEKTVRIDRMPDTPEPTVLGPEYWQQQIEYIVNTSPAAWASQRIRTPQGNARNTWYAIQEAFGRGADFVIVAEDDILVATDTLRYFQHAAEAYQDSPFLAILAHSESVDGRPDKYIRVEEHVERTERFNPLVWGTWRNRWEKIVSPTWDFDYSTGEGTEKGWDWNLTRVAAREALYFLRPVVSRSQHVGATGLHCTPELQEAIFLPGWSPDFPIGLWPAPTPAVSARDELAKLIFTADNANAPDPEQAWAEAERIETASKHPYPIGGNAYAYLIADSILAEGYRKP